MAKNLTLRTNAILAVARPDIMEDWDTDRNSIDPNEISVSSQSMAHWQCHINHKHRWMNTISQMVSGAGCPGCIAGADRKVPGRKPKEGESLADVCPDAVAWWNSEYNGDITPWMLTPGSPHKYWLYCEIHDVNWLAKPWELSRGRICPLCTAEARKKERETPEHGMSFADLYPDEASEWDRDANSTTPDMYKPTSRSVAHFFCRKHKLSYATSIRAKVGGVGCRKCVLEKIASANSVPAPGRSLAEVYPELALEWDEHRNGNLTPRDISCTSGKKVHWKCPKNSKHHYMATVANRVWEGSACPFCSGRQAFPGETDIATTHPWLVEEWDEAANDLTPQEVTKGSHYRAHWICRNNPEEHKWVAEVKTRTLNDAGCPYCSAQLVGDINAKPKRGMSLADLFPNVAQELCTELNGDLNPFEIAPYSGKRYYFRCPDVEEHAPYLMSIYNRTKFGQGCPVCGHAKVGVTNATPRNGNSLAEKRPDLVDEWDERRNGKKATEVCYGSGIDAFWICKRHGSYVMPPSRRVGGGCGCPQCAAELRVSFPEKAMFYYIHKVMPDALPNCRPEGINLGRFELDVWIPSLNTAFEYDGAHWHQDTRRDVAKDEACKSNDIRLIRIRESGCPTYESQAEMIERTDSRTNESLDNAIRDALLLIGAECDVNVRRDSSEIRGLMIDDANADVSEVGIH